MIGTRTRTTRRESRLLDAGAMLSLFCVGVYAGAFGPVLPFLASDLDVSLDTAGFVLTALFAGSIAASALIAVALRAADKRLLTIFGLGCALSGLLLLGSAPNFAVALAAGVILGVGDGMIIASLHILVAATALDVTRSINRLNIFFALGAIVGPLWSGAILAASGERAIVYAGVACVVAIAALALVASPSPEGAQGGGSVRTGDAAVGGLGSEFAGAATSEGASRSARNATVWTMGVVLFFYVGAEFGLGSWVSSFARESAGASVFGAALLSCAYWAALALGRIGSNFYFARRHDSVMLLAASVAGAGIASVVLALASGNVAISACAAFAAGLCLGPVWPTTVAIAADAASAHETSSTVTIGNAGGLVIPWAQGRVLVGAGPGQGVAVTAVLCGLMLGITGVFRLRRRRVG